MKIINKVMLLTFTVLALSSATTECFYYGDDQGANFMGTAGTATLIGGAASGNRAAIGAGAGLMGVSAIMNASRNNRRRRDDDYYGRRDRSPRSSRKSKYRDLQDENADLRARLRQYENE